MKKILMIAVMLSGLVSSVFGMNIPSGYSKIYSENGFSTYKNGNIYVSVVDLQKCDVKVGNVHKASSSNSFYKHKVYQWWDRIGGLYYKSSSLRYLLFFVSKSSTQPTLNYEISKWGVVEHEVVMMDGSGSAQMKTSNFSDKRRLANVISINRIWSY